MLQQRDAIGEVISVFGNAGADCFHFEHHRTLYGLLVRFYIENLPVDSVVIENEFTRQGVWEQLGKYDFLAGFVTAVPSAGRVRRYAEIVLDKYLLRRLIGAAHEVMEVAYEDDQPARETLDFAEKQIFEVTERRVTGEAQPLPELIQEAFRAIESRGEDSLTGVGTGYYALDELTCGLQPAELIVVAGRPSMGKCLAHDAEVVLADGRVATMAEIHAARQAEIATLLDTWKLGRATPSRFVDDGIKPVFRVTTRLGRQVDTTLSHPFLTLDGWRPLSELSEGVEIAVPRVLPIFGNARMRDCEVRLLGYLLGDGGLTGNAPRFTNSSPAVAAEFEQACREFGGVRMRLSDRRAGAAPSWRISRDLDGVGRSRNEFARRLRQQLGAQRLTQRRLAEEVGVSAGTVSHWINAATAPAPDVMERVCDKLGLSVSELVSPDAVGPQTNTPSSLSAWLDRLGLAGKGSAAKFVPAPVFQLPPDQLAVFLNRLFATDGWITVLSSGQVQLGYASVSERLARQVQHLLLRFGVIGSLRARRIEYRGTRRPAWQLDVTDARSIRTFLEEVGIFGKEERARAALEALARKRYQSNCDLISVEIWKQLDAARGNRSWAEIAARIGLPRGTNLHVGKRGVTRERLARLAAAVESPALAALSQSDVYWDRVVSIEPIGQTQVYDLTIPGTHNFVANDICVHNTAFGLNIAENMSIGDGRPVLFFSLEMSRQQVAQRILCSRARVDSHRLRRGRVGGQDMERLKETAHQLMQAPLLVDDTSNLSILELRARARMAWRKHRIQAIFVDYLQLMHIPKSESRQQEVAGVSRGLKALAKDLNVPVIAMAQLNRNPEDKMRKGNRPRMSDLRESGAIEQDADVIMLLHREAYFRTRSPSGFSPEGEDLAPTVEADENLAEVIIAKQRNGPVDTVLLHFNKQFTRFDNRSISPATGYVPAQGADAPY